MNISNAFDTKQTRLAEMAYGQAWLRKSVVVADMRSAGSRLR
jgi:hypothetical protein